MVHALCRQIIVKADSMLMVPGVGNLCAAAQRRAPPKARSGATAVHRWSTRRIAWLMAFSMRCVLRHRGNRDASACAVRGQDDEQRYRQRSTDL